MSALTREDSPRGSGVEIGLQLIEFASFFGA